MAGPYFIATYNGFLVIERIEGGRDRVYTDADVRCATPFDSFEQADAAAKWGCNRLFPQDISYFAILKAAFA
ncbi:MAG: hypothetical protein ACXWVD_00345 [Telluria sp.]